MSRELTTTEELRELLAQARTFAVLGAHPDEARPANYVPRYLIKHGYRVIPVNAVKAGGELFGEPIRASLTEIDEPVCVVDIFRNSAAVPGHLDELLAMAPRPRVVWMQEGVRHDETAQKLIAEGIMVVQDRCPERILKELS